MSKRFLLTLATLIIIGGAALVAVFLTKGYTFSPESGRIVGTGIISVASLPDGASIYLDGHLTSATNTNIGNLPPKTYKVKISKEGFIPWEKEVKVLEGLVTEIKATLFPSLPTIYPLTYNGVENPILSPDGEKLAFAVPLDPNSSKQKGGIWVWTMTSQPISLARGGQPQQIVQSSPSLDFSQADLRWSPDSKSILLTLQEGGKEGEIYQRNYVLSIDKFISLSDLRDSTPNIAATLKDWAEAQKKENEGRIALIKDLKVKEIASNSARLPDGQAQIKWAPDEKKFMVEAKVYDLENKEEYSLPQALDYLWLPESKHIILVQEGKVAVSELDGGNFAEIYAGKFEDNFVFPWPDSSRLVILTSFATSTASKPNLFGINLK